MNDENWPERLNKSLTLDGPVRFGASAAICILVVLSSSGCILDGDHEPPCVTVNLSSPIMTVNAQGSHKVYTEEYTVNKISPNDARLRWSDLRVNVHLVDNKTLLLEINRTSLADPFQIGASRMDATGDTEHVNAGDTIALNGIDPDTWVIQDSWYSTDLMWRGTLVGGFYLPVVFVTTGAPRITGRTDNATHLWDAEIQVEGVDPVTTKIPWSELGLHAYSMDELTGIWTTLLSCSPLPAVCPNETQAPGPPLAWYSSPGENGTLMAGDSIHIVGMNASFQGSEVELIRMDDGTSWGLMSVTLPSSFP
jgi:hypothetical protein